MAENEAPEKLTNLTRINLSDDADTTPTITLSGAIFTSGGGLWFKGFDDTYTEVAVK